MQLNAVSALGLATLAACGAPTATLTSPSPTSGPPTTAPAAPTPGSTSASEPVHIETNSNGDRYITVVQRVTVDASKRSRIAYELRALSSSADIIGLQSVVSFEEPHITFNDRQGKSLIADSPQAKITQRDKSVLMSGGVHARADDGSVLTCDSLRYDGRTEKLYGAGHVVLSAPGDLTLTGRYLKGDVRLNDVRIAQHPL
jgi:LPS export ABC transporter protein LptC